MATPTSTRRTSTARTSQALEDAGVDTTTIRYDGVPHEFFGMAAGLDSAVDAVDAAAAHLRSTFGLSRRAARVRIPLTRT